MACCAACGGFITVSIVTRDFGVVISSYILTLSASRESLRDVDEKKIWLKAIAMLPVALGGCFVTGFCRTGRYIARQMEQKNLDKRAAIQKRS